MKISFLKNWFLFSFILFLLGVMAFRFSETTGRGPVEYGVFAAYGVSLMEDGDLNIINQLPHYFSWMVTESGSDVDFHEYGKASLGLPLLLMAKLLKPESIPGQTYYHFFFILFNLGAVYLWLNLLNRTCQLLLKEKRDFRLIIVLFFFNIPVWWYSFFQVNGSDLISSLLLNFIVYNFLKYIDDTTWKQIVLQVSLLLFATLVKVTFLFYLPLWGFYIYHHSFKPKIIIRVVTAHLLGLLIIYLPHGIYFSDKFGQMMLGHAENFRTEFFVLWETLFTQNGYLVSTPFYLLGMGGLIFLACKKRDMFSKFLLYMGFWFIVKLILVSFRPIEDELYGSRMIMLDSYLFLIPALLLLKNTYGARYLKFASCILVLGALYSAYIVCIYVNDQYGWNALYNFKWSDFTLGFAAFTHIISSLSIKDFYRPYQYLLMSAIIGGYCLLLGKVSYRSMQKWGTLSIIVSFCLVHFLHRLNFEGNVDKMKANHFYQDKLIAAGSQLYTYDDTISVFEKSMFNAKLRGDREGYLLRERELKLYFESIKAQVIYDPLGFTEGIESGNYRKSAHDY